MTEIGPEITTAIMLLGVLIGVLLGYPLAIAVGALGLIVGAFVFGPRAAFDLYYSRVFELLNNYVLLAIPLFVFMGTMLERSGIAEDLYDALYLWLGPLRGGLAISTVLIGTVMAAAVGILGASVTMLALVALPSMVRRGYDKPLACGSVCAGGTLGILIPPSVMLVVYGPMAAISVGKLFMAAFIPGVTLSALYCAYIGFRCFAQPRKGPSIPVEERAMSFFKKSLRLLGALLPPALLILSVLGVIFLGIAPPTEAASIGAVAATLLALAHRRLNLQVLKETALSTVRISSMILLIGVMSYAFVGVFIRAGGGKVITELILGAPFGRWGAFVMIMFIIFVLGFVIEWLGIVFIMVPIVTPLAPALGFDPLWFSMMICVNLQMSFLTPPFAPALFYLRGSLDPTLGVTMGDIMKGIAPFVILIMVGLGLCVLFPDLILWLPGEMVR
jgi:tripartite ATP-independent transporter DctM subunit